MIKFYGVSDTGTTILLIALCLAGIAAILGSIITLTFYWGKNKIVPFLYRILALTDILTGLNAIYFVILCVTYLQDCDSGFYTVRRMDSENRSESDWVSFNGSAAGCHRNDTFLIPVSFVVSAVVTRLPLLIGVVLSVVRSVNIASPFILVKKSIVTLIIVTWGLLWAGLAIVSSLTPMNFDENSWTPPLIEDKFFDENSWTPPLIEDNFYDENSWTPLLIKDNFYRLLVNNAAPIGDAYLQVWEYMLMLIVSFMVPIFIMLISTAVQIGILFSSRISGSGSSDHIQMTITIILITLLSTACAIPSTYYIAASWSKNRDGNYAINNTLAFMYGFGLPVLNSALNPVLLVVRSAALREHVRSIFRGEFQVGGKKIGSVVSQSHVRSQFMSPPTLSLTLPLKLLLCKIL